MTARKAMALTGSLLALAILSPSSAPAKGTDAVVKDVKATVSGTVSLNVLTGQFTSDATGVSSHLGEYAAHLDGAGRPTPQGTFAGSGTITWVADNGDRLTGTFVLSTDGLPPAPHTTTVAATINGGTGRFANARGTSTTTVQVHGLAFDGVTLVSAIEGTATGQIAY